MNFFFKKSLGQHFLKDNLILEKIASVNDLKNKIVYEVGPGNGALTDKILKKKPLKLIAIEKDKTLSSPMLKLKKKYPNNFEIIFDDVLLTDFKKFNDSNVFLVSNLPYNIATTLILNLLQTKNVFYSLVVMIQKEVANRISANVSSKAYGRISILAQLQSSIKTLFDVTPEKFFPKPSVLSTVIEIKPKKSSNFDYKKLDKILKFSFKQRRKTIRNNLKTLHQNSENIIIKCGIDPSVRPQDIKPEDYINLAEALID